MHDPSQPYNPQEEHGDEPGTTPIQKHAPSVAPHSGHGLSGELPPSSPSLPSSHIHELNPQLPHTSNSHQSLWPSSFSSLPPQEHSTSSSSHPSLSPSSDLVSETVERIRLSDLTTEAIVLMSCCLLSPEWVDTLAVRAPSRYMVTVEGKPPVRSAER